jgi:prephenate dehydrogenase
LKLSTSMVAPFSEQWKHPSPRRYDGDMKVGVYGLGRFGRLWAEMLAREVEVVAANRSEVRDSPEGVHLVSRRDLGSCDAVFLCVAIGALPEVLRQIAPVLRPGQLVADTCSVKVRPLEWMREALPSGVQILGTHPMFGPDSVRDSSEHLPIVMARDRVDDATYAQWKDHFTAMGLTLREMSAEAHDREAAYTQGITHLVGRILADFGVPDSTIATLGYRRLQQVMEQTCNDPYRLFLDLQRYNPYTAQMRTRFTHAVDTVLSSLGGSDNIDTP